MSVSIAQLLDERIWIRPHEAVSLARQIWTVLPADERLVELLDSLGKPLDMLQWLELDPGGHLHLTAPDLDDGRAPATRARWQAEPANIVRLLGRILDRLLPLPDAPPSYRVPERLRTLVQRASQTKPPPAGPADGAEDHRPFRSVEEFLGMLRPFETGDGLAALADLHARWEACHALSRADTSLDGVSDLSRQEVFDSIRRVRETVGVSVSEIAKRSKIPFGLLEKFERGDLTNWPKGVFGRQYVREYAREAGLDPNAILRVIGPRLTPDESIEFIRETWRSAAEGGRPPTFHDPTSEGGRYYPEPVLDSDEPAAAPAATPTPTAGPTTAPPGLLFGSVSAGPSPSVDVTEMADDHSEPHGRGRVATVGFLILVAIAFTILMAL